jgi:hypothetical protein
MPQVADCTEQARAEDEAIAEFIQQVQPELEKAASTSNEESAEQTRWRHAHYRALERRRASHSSPEVRKRRKRERQECIREIDRRVNDELCHDRPRSVARSRERRPRAQATRSSARSGDSGDDGLPESKPHPEPPTRRLCAFCGKDIPADRSPRATYCSERHADRDRQRRKRQRDRARDVRPRIPKAADFRRMLELTEEELAKLRERSACRCNGRHLEFERGECSRCGHSLPRALA